MLVTTGIIAMVLVGLVVSGALFSFFVQHTAEIHTYPILEWDGQPAENLYTDEAFTLNASETREFNHTIMYRYHSSQQPENILINYTWSQEPGITATITYNGLDVSSMSLEKGVLYHINTKYVANEHLKSGTYQINLTIE